MSSSSKIKLCLQTDSAIVDQMSSSSSIISDVSLSSAQSRSPERPQRGRGRARMVGRGGGRSQPAGRGRGRGSRGKARVGQTETGAVEGLSRPDQQQILMDEIHAMSREEIEALLVQTVRVNPGLMFYVMRPAVAPEGRFHPPGGQQSPPWCSCGQCRDMPTPVERVCCGKRVCITLTPEFDILILDERVLALGRLLRRDILVFPDEQLGEEEDDYNAANRFHAYTNYTLWRHGRLGAGVRLPLPACAVWKIRDKFPHPYAQYTGFKPSRV